MTDVIHSQTIDRRELLRRTACAFCGTLALGSCGQSNSYRFRYMLKIRVFFEKLIHESTSVVEMQISSPNQNYALPSEIISRRVYGEANTMRLNSGSFLFALLTSKSDADGAMANLRWLGSSPELLLSRVYGVPWTGFDHEGRSKALDRIVSSTGQRPIEPEDLPTLVTFQNILEPDTVQLVEIKDMSRTLGDSARIESASIGITDQPITRGIEKILPWIPSYNDKMLDGRPMHDGRSLANDLSPADFIRRGY